tara:strand:+ start:4250 stop:5695 length:1446 start_codon:yes stop_codon:yes gene_type:complete
MKLALRIIGLVTASLLIIVLVRTFNFQSPEKYSAYDRLEVKAYPDILAKALSFETISHKAGMIDDSAFSKFHLFLENSFPLVHQKLKLEKLNKYSLLFHWEGLDPQLDPIVIMAHQDVVPAEYSSLDKWDYPPFSGVQTDSFIYGRGSLDDKGSLISILNACEELLKINFKPNRSMLFCFGHDEEIGGKDGGLAIAQLLENRGIRAHMVLDEGGNIVSGLVPGIDKPVALVGTSEKGYVSLELSAEIPGGHSSMPNSKTAIGQINKALYKLEQNPLPNRITEPLHGFISCIGPELPFSQKMAFANTWLFQPLIFKVYEGSASGSALIHSTQVATIFQSGIKDNVIPNRAKATVNYRLLPGDEPSFILERARKLIGDSLVKIRIFEDFSISASPVSDYKSEAFRSIGKSIKAVFPEAIVSPYLVIAATDSRHFYNISDHVYRFAPIVLTKEDLPRLHGINERISILGYEKSVRFYATLMKNS